MNCQQQLGGTYKYVSHRVFEIFNYVTPQFYQEEGYFPFLGFSHEEIGLLGGFSINKGIGLKVFDDLLD
ncbi:Uncharacterised protein [Escherichia coli]|nr:Uncharacterised protein [Escherichia coli]